jgi:superfamily II DNA or RNA helicase
LIKQKEVNTLVVVPSKALKRYIHETLSLAFGSDKVEMIDAASMKKSKGKFKPIRICNVQTLAALQKKGSLLDELVADIDMFIVDEVHHSGAKSYLDLLAKLKHVYYRYGFTGTFLRNDSKTLDMHGFLSNRIYLYKPKTALEDKFLTPIDYVINRVQGIPHKAYPKEYELNYCGSKGLLSKITEIVQSIPAGEQILVLVKQKEKSGAIIHEWLTQQGYPNTYISGDDKSSVIDNAIEAFNEKTIKILIGSSVIGEGIDLYSAQHLILATGGKSEVAFTQALGRAVRLSPGKARSCVYDFSFQGARYLDKHLKIRLETFQRDFAGHVSIVA